MHGTTNKHTISFNLLNAELNPICYLLALLGAHHFFHVSRIRVKMTVALKASVKLDIFALYKLPLDKIHFSRRSTTVHDLKVS
jgi:hypothetical protein